MQPDWTEKLGSEGGGGGEEKRHHVMHITLSTDYMEGIHGNKKVKPS